MNSVVRSSYTYDGGLFRVAQSLLSVVCRCLDLDSCRLDEASWHSTTAHVDPKPFPAKRTSPGCTGTLGNPQHILGFLRGSMVQNRQEIAFSRDPEAVGPQSYVDDPTDDHACVVEKLQEVANRESKNGLGMRRRARIFCMTLGPTWPTSDFPSPTPGARDRVSCAKSGLSVIKTVPSGYHACSHSSASSK